MRIGIGYDIHRLVEDRPLVLCGVQIPYLKGLLGYSDGDAAFHAVADAVLGALSLGDIGTRFPNTDPSYKNIASREIVKKAVKMVKDKGYAINNIDVTIVAEEPKFFPFRDRMLAALADAAGVGKEAVSVKSTTNEGVGAIGKGEAIAAYAVVALVPA